jgi:asparagine synthase (glutamine-hydrolysing)
MCSGGVDSSLIAAVAHDSIPDLVGYVADAPIGSGEGAQAERVGRHIGIPIRNIGIGRDEYLRLLSRATWHLDAPPYHPSEAALLGVTTACRADGIKVVLTGEGADELFGGYPWYTATRNRWLWRDWRKRLGEKGAGASWQLLPIPRRGDFETNLRRQLVLDADAGALSARLFDKLSGIENRADRAFLVSGLTDLYSHLALLLHRHDHMGMAASIEMRVPFIENALIDFAIHLPRRAKQRGRQRKWTEKMVAAERLPRDIVFARKRGFPMPQSYFRGTERLLAGGLLAEQLGWSRQTTEWAIDSFRQSASPRFLAVSMEVWLQQTLGGQSIEAMGEALNRLAA